jgi:hypothetical protein
MAIFEDVRPMHKEKTVTTVTLPVRPAIFVSHFSNQLRFSLNALYPLPTLLLSSYVKL